MLRGMNEAKIRKLEKLQLGLKNRMHLVQGAGLHWLFVRAIQNNLFRFRKLYGWVLMIIFLEYLYCFFFLLNYLLESQGKKIRNMGITGKINTLGEMDALLFTENMNVS